MVRRRPDLTGLCVATVFFWLSLTPSLVPRPWILQGVIGGITAAIGYAVGGTLSGLARVTTRGLAHAAVQAVLASRPALWRRSALGGGRAPGPRLSPAVGSTTRPGPAAGPRALPAPRPAPGPAHRPAPGPASRGAEPRPPLAVRDRVRVWGWWAYGTGAPVLSAWLLSESADMQRRLRRMQELPPGLTWHTLMIALIAVALCALLVLAGRSVRLGARRLIRALDTWLPRPVAVVAGLLLTGMVMTVGLRDVVFDRGIVDVADRIAETTNRGTKEGVERPTSPYVSGGPGSLVPWERLGYQGRNFTGTVPDRRDIAAFTGRPAADPIRVYVSSEVPRAFTGPDDENEPFRAQARLAVQELERTGAFEREVLAVAGTTGSGWIDSNVAQALEYLHGGDTAIVAVQYSYLPSWVSFLVDEEKAGKATRALVDAVRERWERLPTGDRPRLVVTGESLGAYAVERAFDGIDDLLASTDGALLIGTPAFSPIARELREARDPGSPVWRPGYDGGRHVRWAQFPDEDLSRPVGAPWATPRVVYLQNASDPIVWWSTDLLFSRPEWMEAPRGPDVTPEINWFPFVAFWQTTVDMAVSYGVEAPHGHRYGAAAADGWAAVVPPDGWTAEDTRRLHAHLAGRKTPY
ncbi:alpha/beta-hydrolase family protein [Streptomyces sp. MUM 203J]|uniref:alpha/beta hydrolase n=1 Tax=Streptomyces sp. MUM 203J TaxID=2791990 RepID=UPI001F042955|nr:alpha/beta-hydrolase family protein [Streptomyces sp. MUM 203J]